MSTWKRATLLREGVMRYGSAEKAERRERRRRERRCYWSRPFGHHYVWARRDGNCVVCGHHDWETGAFV